MKPEIIGRENDVGRVAQIQCFLSDSLDLIDISC